MAVSYFTSNTLIESIKNRALIPSTQQTFTSADFLRFANEEMLIGIVPLVERFHEEFFIFEEATPLVSNQRSYEIPYRATGNKLRSLYLLDAQQNRFPMTRVSADDLEYYQGNGYGQSIYGFYIANNTVNLLNVSSQDSSSKLLYSYYMRPNKLVEETRVAKVASVAPSAGTNFSTPGGFTTGTNQLVLPLHNLIDGVSGKFSLVGAATLPEPFNTSDTYYIKVLNPSLVEIYSDENLTLPVIAQASVVTPGTGTFTANTYDITLQSTIPSVFTSSETYDIIQTKSPHKTLRYDLAPVYVSGTVIRFKKEDMRRSIDDLNNTPVYVLPKVGDMITISGETIIPQIPDELHSMLAQRVACRCLEALGDREGLAAANAKLAEMEERTATLINDRVEGSPQKVVNHNSPLRQRFIGSRITRS